MPRFKATKRDEGDRPSSSAYSRTDSAERYSGARKKRGRKRGLKVFLIALVVIAAIGCTAAFAVMMRFSSSFGMAADSALHGTLTEAASGDPFYMVLIGVDKDQARVEGSEYGANESAYRTDTILLARVDPTEKQVTLVSIHRDTLIDFGSYGKQKINAAYSIGAERQEAGEQGVSGASYTVETISKFAGVPIAHYAEIDFDQFISVVDAIGGIEVNVPVDVYDPEYTGAILKKVLASDPVTIASTVTTMADSVQTDLSIGDIVSLATQFQGFDMSTNMFSGMEPTNSKYVNDTWYEICDTANWRKMMTRVNQGLSPYENEDEDVTRGVAGAGTATKGADGTTSAADSSSDSSAETSAETDYSGTVEVLNGAGVEGLAGRVAATLDNQGFDTTAATADSYDYSKTRIIYVGDANKAKAQAVADTLGLSNLAADDGTYAGAADVVVILGSDMANN